MNGQIIPKKYLQICNFLEVSNVGVLSKVVCVNRISCPVFSLFSKWPLATLDFYPSILLTCYKHSSIKTALRCKKSMLIELPFELFFKASSSAKHPLIYRSYWFMVLYSRLKKHQRLSKGYICIRRL